MSTVLLRRVATFSVVHRLWAGTKILGALAISLLLMVLPAWPTLGVVAIFLVGTAALAHVPAGAIPRPPWWLWFAVVLVGALNAVTGPEALVRYLQTTVFGLLLFTGAMVIAWTTPMNEIAPAIAVLGRPLHKLRLPVDEWAVAIALTLRSLPLLIEELRILRAARRLRPKNAGTLHDAQTSPIIDIITATMAVAMRRASELGEAITARGGTGQLTAYPARPGRNDVVALLTVTVVCGLGVALGVLL